MLHLIQKFLLVMFLGLVLIVSPLPITCQAMAKTSSKAHACCHGSTTNQVQLTKAISCSYCGQTHFQATEAPSFQDHFEASFLLKPLVLAFLPHQNLTLEKNPQTLRLNLSPPLYLRVGSFLS